MIHYSCDRCKRSLDPADDLRYVVNLEVRAAMEPVDPDETEADRDHLLEIHEILESLEDGANDEIGADIYQQRRFDLCSECYRRYIKDPLGAESLHHVEFSAN